MPRSSAKTVGEYLADLPEERRAVVAGVRDTILANLPKGYEETFSSGMISYEIPLARYPKTYNKKPLQYAALAAQKKYFALYLNGVYQDQNQLAWLEGQFQAAGKRLDIGMACVRFKRLADLPLPVVGEVIASTPPDRFIALYESSRRGR